MSNITFVLFTYNEEKRVSYAIRNFIKYGEVIVLDGGSTDKTKEAVESLGAKFYLRPTQKAPVETEENFEFIKSKITSDWIYWGFIDNLAPKSLVEKLVEISSQDKFKMALIPINTFLWGNTKNYAVKGYAPMLFHKDYVSFANFRLHNVAKFTGNKEQLLKLPNQDRYALIHFSIYNINKFVTTHLYYAEVEAVEKFRDGKKFSLFKMIIAMFGYVWICRKSLKNGSVGLIVVLSYAFYRLMHYARLYELESGITLESIEKNYCVLKDKMIDDFK